LPSDNSPAFVKNEILSAVRTKAGEAIRFREPSNQINGTMESAIHSRERDFGEKRVEKMGPFRADEFFGKR
jgi:hypothetical protein